MEGDGVAEGFELAYEVTLSGLGVGSPLELTIRLVAAIEKTNRGGLLFVAVAVGLTITSVIVWSQTDGSDEAADPVVTTTSPRPTTVAEPTVEDRPLRGVSTLCDVVTDPAMLDGDLAVAFDRLSVETMPTDLLIGEPASGFLLHDDEPPWVGFQPLDGDYAFITVWPSTMIIGIDEEFAVNLIAAMPDCSGTGWWNVIDQRDGSADHGWFLIDGQVIDLDLDTGDITWARDCGRCALIDGGTEVWVLGGDGTVGVDKLTHEVSEPVPIACCRDLLPGDGAIWYMGSSENEGAIWDISRYDRSTGEVIGTYDIEGWPTLAPAEGIVSDPIWLDGAIWNHNGDTLYRHDADTFEVTAEIDIDGLLRVEFGPGGLWYSSVPNGDLVVVYGTIDPAYAEASEVGQFGSYLVTDCRAPEGSEGYTWVPRFQVDDGGFWYVQPAVIPTDTPCWQGSAEPTYLLFVPNP